MEHNKKWVPYCEKYRPTIFDNIVLDEYNRKILQRIIDTSYFPNLIFYGPPGTGKTTTIMNLIDAYQVKLNNKNRDLIIHLNASDERGIDIIRNQISCFVNAKPLFHTGMKFVILDEVDYMTKNAQQALRYLIQSYSTTVRFCLICNYISRIDDGLQNEFIKLHFNQLPKENIVDFLNDISIKEKLNISISSLISIQKLYKSDIRSMVNFLQSNQHLLQESNTTLLYIPIIEDDVWEILISKLKQNIQLSILNEYLYDISIKYNIDKKNIIKFFLNYIISNYKYIVTNKFLKFVENVMHSDIANNDIIVTYSLSYLAGLFGNIN